MSEDELLEELRRLVDPPFREPPAESIEALRSVVRRQFSRRPRRPWWRKKVTVGAAVVTLVTGAPAAAFAATGAPLPDPLRTVMHAVDLPVDSAAVADAKAAEHRLKSALRGGDASAINAAAARLQVRLSDLNRTERNRFGPRVAALLQSALNYTEAEAAPGPVSPSGNGEDTRRPSEPTSGSGEDANTTTTRTSQPQTSSSAADPGGSSGSDESHRIAPTSAGDGFPAAQTGQSDGGVRTVPPTATTVGQGDGQPGSTTTVATDDGSGLGGSDQITKPTTPP
jgi:hypothetical protein